MNIIDISDVKENLREITQLGKELSRNLRLLRQKVKHILAQIKLCSTKAEADVYLDMLDHIQQTLAEISIKENIGIPEKLEKFMYDFDRLDDEQHRTYYFNIIKKEYYHF